MDGSAGRLNPDGLADTYDFRNTPVEKRLIRRTENTLKNRLLNERRYAICRSYKRIRGSA
jgi:hypothetical protein